MADTDFHQAFVRLRSKGPSAAWFVHPELRPRLVEDAKDQGTNMTEIAAQILCRHFQVPYVPAGRKTSPKSNDDVMNVRIPTQVYRILTATYGAKYQDGIRQILCHHYGLRVPAPVKQVRRPRRRRAAAA